MDNDTKSYEEITNIEFIFTLLKRLQQKRVLLQVKVPLDANIYNSAVLDVTNEPKQLILDELNSESGHHHVEEMMQVQVKAAFDTVALKFESSVLRIDKSDSIARYIVALPATLWYYHQRGQFRIKLPLDTELRLLIKTEDGDSYRGQVRDISLNGISANFTGKVNMSAGDVLEDCLLIISEELSIPLTLNIRHIEIQESKIVRVGALIKDLTGNDRKHYDREVFDLQRASLRNTER